MESTINLLPDKDKQLKRDVKRPKDVVEMSTPQDRVFQERVVRIGGVLDFFKNLFKRKPAVLPKIKPAAVAPRPVNIPAPTPGLPPGPVTRVQAMPERFAPKPPSPTPAKGFLSRLFGQEKKPDVTKARPPLPPPPPPTRLPPVPPAVPRPSQATPVSPTALRTDGRPTLPPVPTPPARHAPVWTPPVPTAAKATPPPPAPTVGWKPPAPDRRQLAADVREALRPPAPAGRLSEPSPILGAGLNVNLVPEEYQPEAPDKDKRVAIIAIGAAMLVVAAATVGLNLYRSSLNQKIATLKSEGETLAQQIAVLESGPLKDADVLRQRSTDVTYVLNQHVYWGAFFEKLEAVTLPTVAYGSMSVDVSGSVSLSAVATSFDEVGKQLLTYQNAKDFITEATILSATKAEQAATAPPPGQAAGPATSVVSFSVSLRVSPAIFYRTR